MERYWPANHPAAAPGIVSPISSSFQPFQFHRSAMFGIWLPRLLITEQKKMETIKFSNKLFHSRSIEVIYFWYHQKRTFFLKWILLSKLQVQCYNSFTARTFWWCPNQFSWRSNFQCSSWKSFRFGLPVFRGMVDGTVVSCSDALGDVGGAPWACKQVAGKQVLGPCWRERKA